MKKTSLIWGLMKKDLFLSMGTFMMVYSVLETYSSIPVHAMAVDYSSIGGIEVTACSHLLKKHADFP